MNHRERVEAFTSTIWNWYARHKRDLPWRDIQIEDDAERAYRVLVSEVMLQQTQVSRVKIVFKEFMERFPSIIDLANASNTDVIMAWRGMGYNSRALRLRDAAVHIVSLSESEDRISKIEDRQARNSNFELRPSKVMFPKTMPDLLAIKGIGPYTAAAVLNFAFNIPTPCIDTNIRRILHRTFYGPENLDSSWRVGDGKLLELADEVLKKATSFGLRESSKPVAGSSIPVADARNWHAALMDFGSLVQTKNYPKWDICPLTEKGIMKATPANWKPPVRGTAKKKIEKEPGREVAGRFIPNRIFRGKIVEVLRDAKEAVPFEYLGKEVCIDWSNDLEPWLKDLLTKLIADELVVQRGKLYRLS